jgi:hypothetical protein
MAHFHLQRECHDIGRKPCAPQDSIKAYDNWLEGKGGWRLLPQSTESPRMSRLGELGWVHESCYLSA